MSAPDGLKVRNCHMPPAQVQLVILINNLSILDDILVLYEKTNRVAPME